ncbi:P43 5S RNA-binding protein-like [Pelodytes ibericus]
MLGQKPPSKAGEPRLFSCNAAGCEARFKKEWRLREHMCKHTEQKPLKCNRPGCGAAFSRKVYLVRHLQKHLGMKKYRCSSVGCRAAFASKNCLKRHTFYKHGNDGPFKCSVPDCVRTFHKKRSLRLHLSEHSGELLFICDFPGCEKKLESESQLSAHRRRHGGYPCPYKGCQIVLPTWSSLQKHRKKHPLALQCPTCQKQFNKQSVLQRHKALHRKVRIRLSCPREDCMEIFSTVFNLMHHVRKTHLCLQTNHCYHAGCNRTFSMRESLLRHLVTHDPERKKLKLKFQTPIKMQWRGATRTLPSVEQNLSRLFNQKLLFKFKTLMESDLSSLYNERQLRDPAEPEYNLSGLFQLPPSRTKPESGLKLRKEIQPTEAVV